MEANQEKPTPPPYDKIWEGIICWFLERNPGKTRLWAEWETKMLFARVAELKK